MDRFIVTSMALVRKNLKNLKSNMDRFIVVRMTMYQTHFKI